MERTVLSEVVVAGHSNSSGVSWGAVIAGAFAAAALSLALLALGTGVGLSSVSPWANSGASASSIGWTAIIWLVLMEIIASSMGGYLAGRLRTRWVNVHTHEVYFRDTAHGFLVWAVGLVITAAFLTSAAASMVGRGTTRETGVESSQARQSLNQDGYFVDTLLRTTSAGTMQDSSSLRAELGLIFAKDIMQGGLPEADKSYLAEVVVARAGVSEPEAERRVDDAFGQAQRAADAARKAIAHSMYWTFLALLVGAFCASVAATIGGRQRDHVVVV